MQRGFRPTKFSTQTEKNSNNYHAREIMNSTTFRLKEFIFLVHPYIVTTENLFVSITWILNWSGSKQLSLLHS